MPHVILAANLNWVDQKLRLFPRVTPSGLMQLADKVV